MTSRKLQNAQAITTIVSAIAVPIIVAIVGWRIQVGVSTDNVRKDYVQMAVGILSNPRSDADQALRQWAIAVLDKNSPVPFTDEVRTELENGTLIIRPKLFTTILKTSMMRPPQPWVDAPKNPTMDSLLANYGENLKRAQHNYLGLKYLQEAVREGAAAETEDEFSTDEAHKTAPRSEQ